VDETLFTLIEKASFCGMVGIVLEYMSFHNHFIQSRRQTWSLKNVRW